MTEASEKSGFFTLINALIKAQSEIEHATKDGMNPFFGSGYATLEQIITAVKKPLNDNGIYFQQESHENEVGACVETTFWGHGANLPTGKVTIPAERSDAQSFGSALTYAKRYSLSMACGIGHQKDDDANSATFEEPTSNESKPVKKPAVKPAKKVPVEKAPAKPALEKEQTYDEEWATTFLVGAIDVMQIHDKNEQLTGYWKANTQDMAIMKSKFPALREELDGAFVARSNAIKGNDLEEWKEILAKYDIKDINTEES